MDYSILQRYFPHIHDEKDAQKWLSKLPVGTDTTLFFDCLKKEVMEWIQDKDAFVKALVNLKKNPYVKVHLGEDPNKYLQVRDLIASLVLKGDVEMDNEKRYTFATWALWNKSTNKGKMYIPIPQIVSFCNDTDLDLELFFKHLRKPINGSKGVLISADLFEAEKSIAGFLKQAKSLGISPKQFSKLDTTQNSTVASLLEKPFAALQGSAGVGKTTVVSNLVDNITSANITVFCLAFTHKAKRCIYDKLAQCNLTAHSLVKISTIHSFIAMATAMTRLPECYIIIDESSMLDIELLALLAQTVMVKCTTYQLLFCGDVMQLSPILRGEFFRNMIDTCESQTCILYKCYRTDRDDLFKAYQSIRNGILPESSKHFHVINVVDDNEINSHVGKMIYKELNNLLENTVIVAWQNKDVFKINQWAQAALLKKGIIGPMKFNNYYKGDKVIYRGDNTKTLTNAMIGHVCDIRHRSMTVNWEDGTSSIVDSALANSIALAYALTVHCLQGSECDKVIVACYEINKMKYCLDRRFLYTAVTRGKKEVFLITTSVIQSFLNNDLKPQPLSSIFAIQ